MTQKTRKKKPLDIEPGWLDMKKDIDIGFKHEKMEI